MLELLPGDAQWQTVSHHDHEIGSGPITPSDHTARTHPPSFSRNTRHPIRIQDPGDHGYGSPVQPIISSSPSPPHLSRPTRPKALVLAPCGRRIETSMLMFQRGGVGPMFASASFLAHSEAPSFGASRTPKETRRLYGAEGRLVKVDF